MQCADNDPTGTGHGEAKSDTATPKTSSIPPKPRADQQTSHRICADGAQIQPNRNPARSAPLLTPRAHTTRQNGETSRVTGVGKAESGTSTQQLREPRSTTFSRPEGLLTSSANGDGSCGGSGDGEAAAPAGPGAAISPLAQATGER